MSVHQPFSLPIESGGRGFGPRSFMRMPLPPVCRPLPLSLNALLQWDDDYGSCSAIVIVSIKAATAACVFLVAFVNADLTTARTLTIAPYFVSKDVSLADTLTEHSCEGSGSG